MKMEEISMKLKVCPNCNSKRINEVAMFRSGYEAESYYCMDCGKEFVFKLKSSELQEIYSDSTGDITFFKFVKRVSAKKPSKRVLLAR